MKIKGDDKNEKFQQIYFDGFGCDRGNYCGGSCNKSGKRSESFRLLIITKEVGTIIDH